MDSRCRASIAVLEAPLTESTTSSSVADGLTRTGQDGGESLDSEVPSTSASFLQSPFHASHRMMRALGSGTFGRVYSAVTSDETGEEQTCAVKVSHSALQSAESVQHECCALQAVVGLQHCVQFMRACLEGPYSYIVTELCDMPMPVAIASQQTISEVTMAFFFRQACAALVSIHGVGVRHLDVKPDSFMVVGREHTVKLMDFGVARLEVAGGDRPTGAQGTAPFMSPEMLSGDGYGKETDVWSLGVSLYALMLGNFPYHGKRMHQWLRGSPSGTEIRGASRIHSPQVMKAAIRMGMPHPSFCFDDAVASELSSSAAVSGEAQDLLRALLRRCPEQRASAAEALKLPWLAKFAGVRVSEAQALACSEGSAVDLRVALESAGANGAFSSGGNAGLLQEIDVAMAELQARKQDREQAVAKTAMAASGACPGKADLMVMTF